MFVLADDSMGQIGLTHDTGPEQILSGFLYYFRGLCYSASHIW
jgi:hypothetical protein